MALCQSRIESLPPEVLTLILNYFNHVDFVDEKSWDMTGGQDYLSVKLACKTFNETLPSPLIQVIRNAFRLDNLSEQRHTDISCYSSAMRPGAYTYSIEEHEQRAIHDAHDRVEHTFVSHLEATLSNGVCLICRDPETQEPGWCTEPRLLSVVCHGCGKVKPLLDFPDDEVTKQRYHLRTCTECLMDRATLCQRWAVVHGGIQKFACGGCKRLLTLDKRVRLNEMGDELYQRMKYTDFERNNIDGLTLDNMCLACADERGWKYEPNRKGNGDRGRGHPGFARIVEVCIRYDSHPEPNVIVIDPVMERGTCSVSRHPHLRSRSNSI